MNKFPQTAGLPSAAVKDRHKNTKVSSRIGLNRSAGSQKQRVSTTKLMRGPNSSKLATSQAIVGTGFCISHRIDVLVPILHTSHTEMIHWYKSALGRDD